MRSDRDDKKPEGQSKAELLSWRGNLARIAVCVEEMSKLKRRSLLAGRCDALREDSRIAGLCETRNKCYNELLEDGHVAGHCEAV